MDVDSIETSARDAFARGNKYMAREIIRNALTDATEENDRGRLSFLLDSFGGQLGAKWEGNANVDPEKLVKYQGGEAPTLASLKASSTPEEWATYCKAVGLNPESV